MASNSTGLLPGQAPPISIITASDQSGVVFIGTALALTIALISLLIRGYMQLQIRRQYLLDDFVVAGSMVGIIMPLDLYKSLTLPAVCHISICCCLFSGLERLR